MKKTRFLLLVFLGLLFIPNSLFARSSYDKTVGIMALGNVQLFDSAPLMDFGFGGGAFFDYRFNQRFSLTVDSWFTLHDGRKGSNDNGFAFLGIPTTTLKLYILDNDVSRWDPYIGIGLGIYALTEGSVDNGTSGAGLGAQLEVGVNYYLSNAFSLGVSGVFRSVAIVSFDQDPTEALAIVPYTLMARIGYHF